MAKPAAAILRVLAAPSLAGADSEADAAPVSEEETPVVEVRVVMADVLLPPVGYGATMVELAMMMALVVGATTIRHSVSTIAKYQGGKNPGEAITATMRGQKRLLACLLTDWCGGSVVENRCDDWRSCGSDGRRWGLDGHDNSWSGRLDNRRVRRWSRNGLNWRSLDGGGGLWHNDDWGAGVGWRRDNSGS